MEVRKPESVAFRGEKKLPPGAFRVGVSDGTFSVSILFVPGKKAELVGKWDEGKQRGDCFVPASLLRKFFAAAAVEVKGARQQQERRAAAKQQIPLFS